MQKKEINLLIIILQHMKAYKYIIGSLVAKILAYFKVEFGNKKGRHGVYICRLNFLKINKEVRKPKAATLFKERTVRSMIESE